MTPTFPLTLLLAGRGTGTAGHRDRHMRRSALGSLFPGPRLAPHHVSITFACSCRPSGPACDLVKRKWQARRLRKGTLCRGWMSSGIPPRLACRGVMCGVARRVRAVDATIVIHVRRPHRRKFGRSARLQPGRRRLDRADASSTPDSREGRRALRACAFRS